MNEHSFLGVFIKIGVLSAFKVKFHQGKDFALFSTGAPFS
jgi:hypothetical protein